MVERIALPNIVWRDGELHHSERIVATEVPVAISYLGSTQAVLMATPSHLEDLAIGFSITEGIVSCPSDIISCALDENEFGFDVRVEIGDIYQQMLGQRRRTMVGPVGCGLCGIDSLEQAVRRPPIIEVEQFIVTPKDIATGMALMTEAQSLNRLTRSVHAAGYYSQQFGLVAVREDVGRHNAFDKLIGACVSKTDLDVPKGMVVVSSRLSVDMVQKAAFFGVPIIVAVSAPTDLALATAESVGLTVVAVARGSDFEVFTHTDRVDFS